MSELPLLPTPTRSDGAAGGRGKDTERTRWPNAEDSLRDWAQSQRAGFRNRLTSSQEDSPVSPSQPPASAKASRTTATSGPSSPERFAHFDRAASCSRTSPASSRWLSTQESLFLGESWPTWPKRGMWDSGSAFALPMSGLLTGENGSLLLPTPRASDTHGQGSLDRPENKDRLETRLSRLLPTRRATRGGSATETVELLPTPQSADAEGGRLDTEQTVMSGRRPSGAKATVSLREALTYKMLPTPTAADGERSSKQMMRGNPTLLGASTNPPSGDGSESPDPLPGQLTLEDGSTPASPSGCSDSPKDGSKA